VEWIDDKAMIRVRYEFAATGLSPRKLEELLIEFAKQGGKIDERKETRPEWKARRDFWYRAVIPMEGFPRGIFIEIELRDDDPDVPMVSLVNAHPQRS
jgi:hypothetical protein